MDEKRQDNQLEPIYNSYMPIQDIAWKTYRERWMIETGGERGAERSVLAAWHDDDDDIYIYIYIFPYTLKSEVYELSGGVCLL